MYAKRREKLFAAIKDNSALLLFSGSNKKMSADAHYPFVVNNNFYYLTGIDQSDVALLLVKGNQNECYLFLDETDELKAKWLGAGITKSEAAHHAKIDIANIRPYAALESILSVIFTVSRTNQVGLVDTIYLDLERHSFDDEKQSAHYFAEKVSARYYNIIVKDCYSLLTLLRMYKDDTEVAAIKEAIKITKEGLDVLMKEMKSDVCEYNLEAEYNYVLNNHQVKPSFTTIAAAGSNATILHYVANNAKVKAGDLVLFDLGVKFNHYCSDISRTFPATGRFSDRQKEIYEIVLDCNKKTIAWLRPGKTFKEFIEFGKSILTEGCKRIGLIKEDSEISQYYYHGLGHFLGLDVHDVGDYNHPFQKGIVITVEPGLYIKEEGIGIRIEDNCLLTEDGCINLSKDIIKEIAEIERAMQK